MNALFVCGVVPGMNLCFIVLTIFWLAASADACPFCDVVGQTLAARRDSARLVAAGEATGDARDDAGIVRQSFVVRSIVRGTGANVGETVVAHVAGAVVGTAILFGVDGERGFEAIAADETLLGYVAAAPPTEAPAPERLRWFARRLEHPDRAVAEDAFAEFGLAAYADVVAAADALDATKLRSWLHEPAIDQRRRGFFGLAVGIVAAEARAAGDVAKSDACLAALEEAIDTPANDLRAGYDGLLGGYLVCQGASAIDGLAARGLLSQSTRPGDARHTLAALRFAWEFLAKQVPRHQVAAAAARLVANPAVAAETVIDLARYEHWSSVDEIAPLWNTIGRDDPLVRRAVAGYLMACPRGSAKDQAARIAAIAPEEWAHAVEAAGLPPRRHD